MNIISKIKSLLGIERTKYYYVYFEIKESNGKIIALRTTVTVKNKYFPVVEFMQNVSHKLDIDLRDVFINFWAEIPKDDFEKYDKLPYRSYETLR